MKKQNLSQEVRRLRAENKRLARENAYLRHRAAQLGEMTEEKGREKELLREMLLAEQSLRRKTYFGFLLFRIRASRWFRIYDKTSFAVRGFLIASKLWRIAMSVFAVIGIGAQMLLVLGLFTVLLPALLLFSVIMAVVRVVSYRKWNAFFESEAQGKRIYLLFLPKKRRPCAYFWSMARAFAKDGVVFVVSRSVFRGGALRIHTDGDGVYRIPFGYSFSFRTRLSHVKTARVIVIY